MDENARMKILEMIEAGTISAEEGLQLLQALSVEKPDDTTGSRESSTPPVNDRSFIVIDTGHQKEESQDTFNEVVEENIKPETSSGSTDDQVFEVDDTAQRRAAVDESMPPGAETTQEDSARPAYDQEYQATDEDSREQATYSGTSSQPLPEDVEKWKRWWMIPLWVGVGATVLAGLWMYNAFIAGGFSFWFLCSWVPLFLGVALMALSYSSRRSRWLHVRIDQKPGERPEHIAISMPLPLGLVSWFFKYFGHYIPNIPQNIQVEEILQAVSDNTSQETPFYVEVDEGDGGEKVKVYIG